MLQRLDSVTYEEIDGPNTDTIAFRASTEAKIVEKSCPSVMLVIMSGRITLHLLG